MSVEDTPDASEITFVNRFTVHAEPEEFERVFADTAAFMTRQPGFVQHTLVRHAVKPDSYVNIARWRSEADLQLAVRQPEFQAHAAVLRTVSTSEPNVYRPVQERVSGGDGPGGR
ncbi:monooxygenase [Saccharothrix ecbatanensis]|jgi:monooxygenase|uniref:Monooxygenase n=1 Tax=Saccharothrix ecbatanensis TaxID=1105145 RepID=A0A7W9LZY7_9PSEU|nr:antibiotic biosynthesis monooxygenase family protein [Saccharothrix ecbatanensis]MBB5802213.1 monooxygenase [Saccharothrix ecbatanensis]